MLAMMMVGMLGLVGAPPAKVVDAMETPSLYTPAQPELHLKWTGNVELETQDFKEGKGALRFHINSARMDEESFPQWWRVIDQAGADWRGYRALRYWVKVTSEDPNVRYKTMCIVVNNSAPLQQFVRHTVPVGKWVQLTDNILAYNRDKVSMIVLYLYETDPSTKDNYTWLVDDLELVPMTPEDVAFDGLVVASKREATVGPLRRVKAGDGMGLGFDAKGRVAETKTGGAVVSGASVQTISGLMIRDWRKGEQPIAVGGEVKQDGDAVRQEATVAEGLKVSARYWPEGDRIRCHVKVADTAKADRPLTMYFAAPVEAEGWTWWDDVRTPRTIGGIGEFWYNPTALAEPRVSAYPFSCISGEGKALGIGVPLEPPRLQRTVYNPQVRAMYIAWDFCLTPAAVKQKQTAEFDFFLYRPDPAWGLRSAVDKYYRYYPDDFVKRVPRDGAWECWGTNAASKTSGELASTYHWGPDSRGATETMADAVKYDNAHGILSLPYIEWTNLHVSLEDKESATNADIIARIREIAEADPKTPLPRRGYSFPYDDRLGPDYDGWMRKTFQAYLKSLMYTADGQVYGRADKAEFSILVAKYIPFNPDPDIPGGAGEFFLNTYRPAIEKYYADNGAKIDGFGWDNFYVSGGCFDYRREHLAYADAPPLFDPLSLAPVQIKDMGTYKLEKRVATLLRSRGQYLIANQGVVSAVPATMRWLDIFGYEWNIRGAETYARTMGHHKPACSLPCAAEHYRDPYVRDHLLYGAWPGGYFDTSDPEYLALMKKYVPIIRRECAAGWEPITLARTAEAGVQIERFGGKAKELLFSIGNGGAEAKKVEVVVDEALMKGKVKAEELVDGAAVTVGEGEKVRFTVEAPAGKVIVVAVGKG